MSKKHILRRRWKMIVNIVTVAALGLLVYALREQLGETFANLQKVNLLILALIIPLEVLNYDAYARMYQALFGLLGHKVRYREMYKVALELNLVNNVFPSGGVSGISYFGLRMRSFGVTGGKSTLVQTMKFVFLFTSFEVLLSIGLLALAIGGKADNLTILIGGSLATFLVITTFALAVIVGSEKRIEAVFTTLTKVANRLIYKFRRSHPETINVDRVRTLFLELHENFKHLKKNYRQLKQPFLFGLMANITEVTVVYTVYLAFGYTINPGAVILAYAVANFAGLVSVLPGGVGIYEALMTGVLATAGVSPAVSLPVTVMYRIMNMGIQMIPGYYFYHRALHKGTTGPTQEAT